MLFLGKMKACFDLNEMLWDFFFSSAIFSILITIGCPQVNASSEVPVEENRASGDQHLVRQISLKIDGFWNQSIPDFSTVTTVIIKWRVPVPLNLDKR
jgi:hypothetical protein